MRKIYLSGLVALAIGAMFTSCSKDNDLYDANAVEEGQIQKFEMEVAQKKAAYNEAFAKEFGTIAPGHDWGFGSAATTRAAISSSSMIDGFYELPKDAEFEKQFNNGNNGKYGLGVFIVFQHAWNNFKAGKAVNADMTKSKLDSYKKNSFKKAKKESFSVSSTYLTIQDVINDFGGLNNFYLEHCYKNVMGSPQHNDFNKLYAFNHNTKEWEYVVNFEAGKNLIYFDAQNEVLKGYTLMANMGTPTEQSPNFLRWNFKNKNNGDVDDYCSDYKILKIEGDYYIGINDPMYSDNGSTAETNQGVNYCSWIFRIVKAQPTTENIPEKKQARIFCEDMGEIGDFDFNDLVFDAVLLDNKDIQITVLAAGGILDYQIDGQNVTLGTMTNTGVGEDDEQIITIKAENGQPKYTNFNDIPVVVYPKGETASAYHYELNAPKGEAPQKFATFVGIEWPDEYVNITRVYSDFKTWVNTYTPSQWSSSWESRLTNRIMTDND